MRATPFAPVLMIALALGLCAMAQQSPNYKLKSYDLNAGGNPKNGIALTSTNFKFSVTSLGEGLAVTGMRSPSFGANAGFPATAVPVSTCTLTCTATAPAAGPVGATVSFASTATPSNCSGSPTFDWNFGDGASHSAVQNTTHTYGTAGTFNWTLAVAVNGVTCTRMGTITILPPPPIITLIKKVSPPFKIVATGSNLQDGIKVYINGTQWMSVVWKKAAKIQITGGAALKTAVPKGTTKTFHFVNPDGGEATMTWGW